MSDKPEGKPKRNNLSVTRSERYSDYAATLDYYPTPPFVTHALITFLSDCGHDLKHLHVDEPAAGGGHMVDVLAQSFGIVSASDLADRGRGFPTFDYVLEPCEGQFEVKRCPGVDDTDRDARRFYESGVPHLSHYPDWTITNPPFKHSEAFVDRALRHSRSGVAMLCRLQFLESKGRYKRLFSETPPSDVLVFAERVQMWLGRLADESDKPSAANAYAWFVWDKSERLNDGAPRLHWIPPSTDKRKPRLPGLE